ncbi:MAG: HPr kinase/phosphatase C-terminal domain-containing protein [Rhodospirillales bacterium]|nr:HPr kinase/phosphatase C-terminal domain-containing protein [Rhodospirillales bacterium]
MLLVHATTVLVDGTGVLIRGPSGSGKSDLALRLIDGGARLVADDQTALEARGGRLWASAPPSIAGKLEVRGLGIVAVPSAPSACLGLVVDLQPRDRIERLPEASTTALLGVILPRLDLFPFEASAPAKLRLAVAAQKTVIISPATVPSP